ncbi:MAG: hypothetical protein COV10_04550 [Candidatus Vogelbacteria bacterium CG10_big_fil_rev_8_21_14_0_10_51_16]|uniref:Glycerophosphoryl diester phosphodiesterase membrane domain-containing protein n=1 Tax=Candidatus Vogelbacteria bacterium CG10_big_fil_rev_8_21_14_0_10_51_16 TaxID=1975045 RepID=A0A2H0RFB3_9BACT|nr:MAG: hypothetical protein COV10_04550 [Candidatus Vogelbacteria bacterium CG10_big_fil_rev_8_21_14_0_10_51_16]
MLFLIPGILATVWFSLAVYVFVVEDKRGMAAFFQSKAYVEGRFWGVLGRMLFVALLLLVIYVPLITIFSFLLVGFNLSEQVFELVMGAAFYVLFLVLAPMTYCYLYELYVALKSIWTPTEIVNTGGRKAKFIVPALVGWVITPLLFGAVIATLLYGLRGEFPEGLIPENESGELSQEEQEQFESLLRQQLGDGDGPAGL